MTTDTLTRYEERTLRLMTTRHTAVICVGFAAMVIGGVYGIWGVQQLDREHAPDPGAAFDRPIARIATAFESKQGLDGVTPESDLEKELLMRVVIAEDLVARLFMTLMRLLISGFIMGFGAAMLAWGIGARSFSRILAKLVAAGEMTPTEVIR